MPRESLRPVAPESYVVRIYRRDVRQPRRVAGTVEVVASGSELSFKSLRELDRILTRPPSELKEQSK